MNLKDTLSGAVIIFIALRHGYALYCTTRP